MLWRIIGRTVCLLTRDDAAAECDSSQLCAGLKCSIKGAIHAANDLFQADNVGMLVMDAKMHLIPLTGYCYCGMYTSYGLELLDIFSTLTGGGHS